jgi:hypothetical protein
MFRHRFVLAAIAAVVAALACAALATPPASRPPAYSVSALPPAPASGWPHNDGAEPGAAVDGRGVIWVAANINGTNSLTKPSTDPRAAGVEVTGADVWKSTDGGRSFSWVADPVSVTGTSQGFGGVDTDVAAAPEPNSDGNYNVYVVSGWVPYAALAVTSDGGRTWTVRHLGGVLPLEDRPYVSADGPCTLYVTYNVKAPFDTVVNRYDVCDITSVGLNSAVNPVQSTQMALSSFVATSNRPGKPVVDSSASSKFRHSFYAPMLDCYAMGPADDVANARSTDGCAGPAEVLVGVTRDGGATFEDHRVAMVPDGAVPNWAVSAGVTGDGTVYVAWSDDHHAYLASSADGGTTWSPPMQLDGPAPSIGDYPTVAGGRGRHVAVAWYGADRAGNTNSDTDMGAPGHKASAPWKLWIAESRDGRHWTRAAVAGPVQFGRLCTLGSLCPGPDGDRTMYENFGAVISPSTDLVTVAYMSDQPSGTTADDRVMVATAPSPSHGGRANQRGGG